MTALGHDEVERLRGELDGWDLEGEAIAKRFERGDFAGSIVLVNRVAEVAEEMGHHPDLEVSWDTVKITITTHSEGGLTAADFELARRIDALG